jgi:hypothetical protein
VRSGEVSQAWRAFELAKLQAENRTRTADIARRYGLV